MNWETTRRPTEADTLRHGIRLYLTHINVLRNNYKGKNLRDEIDKVELKIKELETKLNNL